MTAYRPNPTWHIGPPTSAFRTRSQRLAPALCRYSTVISLASLNYPASLLVFVADIKEFKALLDQRKPQPFNSCHIQPGFWPISEVALIQQRPDML